MLGTPLEPEVNAPRDEDEEEMATSERDSEGVEVTKMGRKMFESMEDVEIVLRFFAYRHLDKFSQGLNRISEFLDEFLVRGNRFDLAILAGYRELFQENIAFWYELSGATAFQVKGSNRHFSKIAFDALMYASSALGREQRAALLSHPQVTVSAIEAMYDQHGPVFGGRRTNTADAHRRNGFAIEALNTALGDIPS
jgi:hypothetical protein